MNPNAPSLPERSPSESDASNPGDDSRGVMTVMFVRNADEADFNDQANEFLSQVPPGDFLGQMQAEMLIAAVIRLRKAAREEPNEGLPGMSWCRYQSLAERNFRSACKEYSRYLESRDKNEAGKHAGTSPASTSRRRMTKAEAEAAARAEAEAARPAPPPRPESTPEDVDHAARNWRKYIAIVTTLSTAYPVILRTGREVEDVTAWLDAGKSEETLMQWFPELSLADIAACKACEAEGLSGPFDPGLEPYPPTLPVLDALPDAPPDDS